ncbi:DgyrCDS9812 [Dimorphilus gyrociliatus]|uniref:Solute carrier organic anion transporter family member n=1 Tax=Dimorphilus gyrociliatus TaxID=2664684 RepID=A0A7I8VZE2_9ANNE|nr:DgyrCDS9812 [Dimorphilus gyrociliatus]
MESVENDAIKPETDGNDSRKIDETMAVAKAEMGWGKYRPQCLQKCASIKIFIACTSMLAMFSSALTAGYNSAVLTTIETRFDVSSSKASLLTAAYETAAVGFLSIVSFLGAKRHIPFWIASGVLIMACGSFVMVTPHLFVKPYSLRYSLDNVTEENFCNPIKKVLSDVIDKGRCDKFDSSIFAIAVLCCAQMMMGIGSTPILTLGPLYIDNHVSKDRAPSFISFLYAFGSVGPVIGFAVGSLVLTFHVDFLSADTKQLNMHSTDSQWVGAWWGGYLILGGLLICLTIPMYSFPKMLSRREIDTESEEKGKGELEEPLNESTGGKDEDNDGASYGTSLRQLPRAVLSIVKNALFMVTTIGITTEIFVVIGFIQFTPKYMENQFLLSQSQANLLTGLIPVPGCMFGILIGGYILRRFQLQAKGAIQLTLAVNIVILMGFLVLFTLGCDNPNLAGITSRYFQSNSSDFTQNLPNLTASCNDHCRCSDNHLNFVCGANGLTYFSPCHAGCKFNYTDCECVIKDLNHKGHQLSNLTALVQDSPCKRQCSSFPVYVIMLFGLTLLVGITQMPLLMISLRSVKDAERSLALGVQLIFLRLLGNVPSPLAFAGLIDRSCLKWRGACGSWGKCLFYDNLHFRKNYIGLGGVVKGFGFLVYWCVWGLIIWKNKREQKEHLKLERQQAGEEAIAFKGTSEFKCIEQEQDTKM